LKSTVAVTAAGASVETTSGKISRTLEEQTVETAPRVGENLCASVATLAPGVTGLGTSFGGATGSGSQGTNSYNSEPGFQIIGAGQRQEANEYQVDGTSVNGNSRDGITNLTPEPESVEQMKVSTDVFSADKGHQSCALIEVFTKPGANQFHGTASEFYTGSALTAKTEFAPEPRYLSFGTKRIQSTPRARGQAGIRDRQFRSSLGSARPFSALRREVAGEVEDELRGVGGEGVDASVGGGHDGHVGGDRAVVGVQG
jgi:hypothetical protein